MISRLFGLIATKLATPLASFLIIVLVARMWGRTILGQYNTIWVWLTIFLYISLFGISEYISKEVGAKRDSGASYLTHGLLFALFTSLICAVIMVGGAVLFKYPEEVKHGIIIASLALPFSAFILIFQAIFIAFQKIKYIALACILESFLFLLMGSAIIIKGYGLTNLIWCLVLARLLSSGFNFLITHRYIARLRFQIDWGFFKKLLNPVAVFGVTGVAAQIFLRVDVVMLSKMTDMAAVGLYSSARKLMEVCLILPVSFYILNLPVAAQGYKSFRESVHQMIEKYTRELFVLAFFIFGFSTFFAESILFFIYGQPFMEAAWILRILMLAFLIMSADMVLAMSCQAAGYHRIAMRIAIGRALTNIVLNFIFIPVWGGLGAAMAALFSIAFSFTLYHYLTKRTLGRFHWIRIIMKPGLVCLFIMALLFPLAGHLNIFLLSLLYFLGYGFTLLVIHGFSPAKAFTSIPR